MKKVCALFLCMVLLVSLGSFTTAKTLDSPTEKARAIIEEQWDFSDEIIDEIIYEHEAPEAYAGPIVFVSTEEQLIDALSDPNVITIFVENDIEITQRYYATINRDISILALNETIIDTNEYLEINFEPKLSNDKNLNLAFANITFIGLDFYDENLKYTGNDKPSISITGLLIENGYFKIGNLDLDSCKIIGSNVTYINNISQLSENINCEIRDCEFIGNDARYGIRIINTANFLIKNTTFRGFSSAVLSNAPNKKISLKTDNCTFSENKSTAINLNTKRFEMNNTKIENSGGNLNIRSDEYVRISECVFDSNIYKEVPNLISLQGEAKLYIDDCKFINNRPTETSPTPASLLEISSSYNSQHEVILNNCLFENNIASENGGAVEVYIGNNYTEFIDCIFKNNEATNGAGGAISSCSPTKIVNCLFEGNKSLYEGGAIVCSPYTRESEPPVLEIENSNFYNNQSKITGGAIYSGGTLKISGGETKNNKAEFGGGIYVPDNVNADNIVEIIDCQISNNTADILGGGICVEADIPITVGTDTVIEKNKALVGGGIFTNSRNIISLDGGVVKDNTSHRNYYDRDIYPEIR